MSRYDIQARGTQRAELYIYGDIGADWMAEESTDAKTVVARIAELGDKAIDVRINSYGGAVADGLAIYNALKRHPQPVTVHIDGVAFSIASLIAMGASRVHMAENALMMIHAPWGGAIGNAADMREMADVLDKYAGAMVGAYVRDGGPGPDTVAGWLNDGKDHYFSAAEALDAGLVDEITAPIDIAAALRGSERFSIPAAFAAQQPTEHAIMAENQTPAAPSEPADPKTIVKQYDQATASGRDEGARAEAQRQKDIRGLYRMRAFNAPQVVAVLDQCLEDVRCDKATAMDRALAAVEALPENVPINPGAQLAQDGGVYGQAGFPSSAPLGGHRQGQFAGANFTGGTTQVGAGIRKAIEIKAGLVQDREAIAQERNNEFLAASLTDLMARELRGIGQRVGGTREDIARAFLNAQPILAAGPSHGTDHLTGILADVANKSALMGWDQAEETWSQWTQTGTLNDYRAAQRANLALLDKLDKMQEHQEWEYGDLADVKQSIQGYFYGKKYALSIQAIVNDDLGELTRAFQAWGEAASATVGDAVAALLTTAGTGGYGQSMDADSTVLFHADHSNYIANGSGAAPSETTLNAAYKAMATQTDPNGRTLGIRPRYILHGATLASTVWRQLNAELLITGEDATSPNANWVRSLGLVPVQEYRLDAVFSGAAWILAAARRTVEVSGVAGPLSPRVERSMISNIPGITYEMSMPFGAAVLDHRGMYFNDGN